MAHVFDKAGCRDKCPFKPNVLANERAFPQQRIASRVEKADSPPVTINDQMSAVALPQPVLFMRLSQCRPQSRLDPLKPHGILCREWVPAFAKGQNDNSCAASQIDA